MARITPFIVLWLFVAGCTSGPAPAAAPATPPAAAPVAALPAPMATAAPTAGAPSPAPAHPTSEVTATAPAPTPIPSATLTPLPSPTVRPSATQTTASPAPPTATPSGPSFTVESGVANVRAGPGTTYPVIGQAAAGQAFAITGRSPAGDWWGFVFEGGQGWISAGVVRANGAASGVAVAANIPPSPTPAPSATPQATPQPTAAARQASCPAWYQTPEPGKGFVVFENFQVARDQDAWPRFEQSGVEGQILVPARAADGTPGRTTFQWSPGKHTVKIQYFHGTIVMDVIVEAGKSYIVPMTEPHRVGWDQQPKTFPVYPLQPPAGCD